MSIGASLQNQAKSFKVLAKEKVKKAMENKKLITKYLLHWVVEVIFLLQLSRNSRRAVSCNKSGGTSISL
jgi:hypothetical protein